VAATAQRRRRGLIAIVAAVIAIGSFLLILSSRGSESQQQQQPPAVPTTQVVVAKTDIKPGDQFSSSNLTLQAYANNDLPPSGTSGKPLYFTSTPDLLSTPHYASAAIPQGLVVLSPQVADASGSGPITIVPLKPGDVAISIPYDVSKGAGGYLQAGDHVDIVVTDPATGVVHYGFQDVTILQVGAKVAQAPAASGEAAAAAPAATLLLLELPREKAAALSFLIDHQAVIRFVLRPRDAFNQGKLPGSDAVGSSNWQSFIDG
jgi:Flp pilus assembly protein CpaB